jgi:hypothetical protein
MHPLGARLHRSQEGSFIAQHLFQRDLRCAPDSTI